MQPRMAVREPLGRRVRRMLPRRVRRVVRVVRQAGEVMGCAQKAVAGQEHHQEQGRQEPCSRLVKKQGDSSRSSGLNGLSRLNL